MVANSWFVHNLRRRYAWMTLGHTRRLQTDYILVKQRYRNSAKNATAHSGANCNSHNYLVMMKVRLKLKRISDSKKIKKWNREKLNSDRRDKFVLRSRGS